jgi:GNAT superfamily N-acetyltransferase
MRGIRPFETADLAEAGRLLAERHATQREAQPLLSKRFEDPATAQAEVAELWQAEGASGAVVESDGRLTGYLIGAPKPDNPWGPNIWVEAAGQAVQDPEIVRDLYGLAAAGWVAIGRTAHYTVVPSHDRDLIDAWFRLGFGQQHVHAIRDVPSSPPEPPSTLTIRRACHDDVDVLAELDLALPTHQGQSPVFSAGSMPTLEEAREDWVQDIDSPEYGLFVAVRDGRVIGSAAGCSVEKSSTHRGLTRPDNAAILGFAAVLPEARGGGTGRAVGEAVNWWAAEAGFDSVVTDWRATNLLSSRTWPRLGFQESFLRLHRMIAY